MSVIFLVFELEGLYKRHFHCGGGHFPLVHSQRNGSGSLLHGYGCGESSVGIESYGKAVFFCTACGAAYFCGGGHAQGHGLSAEDEGVIGSGE